MALKRAKGSRLLLKKLQGKRERETDRKRGQKEREGLGG